MILLFFPFSFLLSFLFLFLILSSLFFFYSFEQGKLLPLPSFPSPNHRDDEGSQLATGSDFRPHPSPSLPDAPTHHPLPSSPHLYHYLCLPPPHPVLSLAATSISHRRAPILLTTMRSPDAPLISHPEIHRNLHEIPFSHALSCPLDCPKIHRGPHKILYCGSWSTSSTAGGWNGPRLHTCFVCAVANASTSNP